jgi:hypothetical protein
MSKQYHNMEYMLGLTDAYDEVEFHLLSHYTSIQGQMDWLRTQMESHGISRPIWIGDATSIDQYFDFFYHVPVIEDESLRTRIYEALTDQEHPEHIRVETWYRARQSDYTVKMMLLAMHHGAAGLHLFNTYDVPGYWVKDWEYLGLIDATIGPGTLTGSLQARPVYRAFNLLVGTVRQAPYLSRVDLGRDDVYSFRLSEASGSSVAHVLWHEGPFVSPWEDEAEITVALPVEVSEVFVFGNYQERDVVPVAEKTRTTDGVVELSINSSPLFVTVQEKFVPGS